MENNLKNSELLVNNSRQGKVLCVESFTFSNAIDSTEFISGT
jgi:hypothetical protein